MCRSEVVDGIGCESGCGAFAAFGEFDGLFEEVDGFGISALVESNGSKSTKAANGRGIFAAAAATGADGGCEECFGHFVAPRFERAIASVAGGFSEGILCCRWSGRNARSRENAQ
jgi:hypothetical protein